MVVFFVLTVALNSLDHSRCHKLSSWRECGNHIFWASVLYRVAPLWRDGRCSYTQLQGCGPEIWECAFMPAYPVPHKSTWDQLWLCCGLLNTQTSLTLRVPAFSWGITRQQVGWRAKKAIQLWYVAVGKLISVFSSVKGYLAFWSVLEFQLQILETQSKMA